MVEIERKIEIELGGIKIIIDAIKALTIEIGYIKSDVKEIKEKLEEYNKKL